MKVICIDKGWSQDPTLPPILEGSVYTVVREVVEKKYRAYVLSERPQDCGYGVNNFIPLSSIDETEFERNYKKELV